MILAHGDEPMLRRVDHGGGVAKVDGGGQGLRRCIAAHPVDALVGVVAEEDLLRWRDSESAAAVFMDARARVEGGRVGVAAAPGRIAFDDDVAAAFARPALAPEDRVAGDPDLPEAHVTLGEAEGR